LLEISDYLIILNRDILSSLYKYMQQDRDIWYKMILNSEII